MLAEELRILYVAFTRAREKLILVGTVDSDKNFSKFQSVSILNADAIQSASRPLDWLIMIKDAVASAFAVSTFDADKIHAPAAEIPAEETSETRAVGKIDKPDAPALDVPAKLSVTEIKRRLDAEDTEPVSRITGARKFIHRRPNFIQKAEMSAAEFGTAMHSVMQHLDLAGDLSTEGILAQIDSFTARQILTTEQAEAVKRRAGNISNFFTTEIGYRIISAREIYRELPFNQNIDAGEIFSGAAGEKIFVQGIIDVLFKDAAGNWILLDYKTDRDNSDEYFRHEYRRQIDYYG